MRVEALDQRERVIGEDPCFGRAIFLSCCMIELAEWSTENATPLGLSRVEPAPRTDVIERSLALVLDDDPTGAQALAGVPVLLEWGCERICRVGAGKRSVHLMTNTRALAPGVAYNVVAEAAGAAVDAAPGARLALRGDSTLRGHVLQEYLALRDAVLPGLEPPLLLVPALPAAGRVTVGGVQMLEQDGVRVPLDRTEYASDGLFAYRDACLLQWAEDRSGGHFARSEGKELHLRELRERGPDAVAETILELAGQARPAAFAPDAETADDLALIAAGLDQATSAGVGVVLRCAPAFVGIWTGTTASMLVDPPAAPEGVLLVCGSYVQTTTRQLERLLEEHPRSLVEVDVSALVSESPTVAITRAARAVDRVLESDRFAVVSTPRERPAGTLGLHAGGRIALGLARVVRSLASRPSVVVAKGGVTSAVTLREGLGAVEAEVVGPIVPGVSLWETADEHGDRISYVVVPGNVGGDELLADLVSRMLAGHCSPC